jgi:hypothetical protein
MTAGLLVIALAAGAPTRAHELEADLVIKPESAESTEPAEVLPDPIETSLEEPAADPGADSNLWAQISERQKDMKSARLEGTFTVTASAGPAGEPVTGTGTIQGESSGNDLDIRMNVQAGASSADMRIILLGDTAYMSVQGKWTSMPRSRVTAVPPRAELPNVDGNDVTLDLVGQDQVKGVPCDVYSLELGPQALVQQMAFARSLNPQAGQMRVDAVTGEVCIGTTDGLLRRLSMNMSVTAKTPDGTPGDMTMDMALTFELFDINSPDIVIRPPAAVTSG